MRLKLQDLSVYLLIKVLLSHRITLVIFIVMVVVWLKTKLKLPDFTVYLLIKVMPLHRITLVFFILMVVAV